MSLRYLGRKQSNDASGYRQRGADCLFASDCVLTSGRIVQVRSGDTLIVTGPPTQVNPSRRTTTLCLVPLETPLLDANSQFGVV